MHDLPDLLGQRLATASESQTCASDVPLHRYHAVPITMAGSEQAGQRTLHARRGIPPVRAPHERIDTTISLLQVAGE